MKIIHSRAEFEAFYAYAPKYKPDKYPRFFPCVAKIEDAGGGLMGEYKAHYVVYFPEKVTPEAAFVFGLTAVWEYVC